MFVTSPYRPNHLQLKFYTIMQDSKRVLGFNCKKRIEQLNLNKLTQHVFQVRLLHFSTISFRPLPLPKSWQSAIRLRLQIFHSTISLPHKKLLFRKFLMTSLRMICGLGPPPIKNPGYAYA